MQFLYSEFQFLINNQAFDIYSKDTLLTTEQATIIKTHVKKVLIKGILDDGGCISLTILRKKTQATNIVISKVTFSPVSGGK